MTARDRVLDAISGISVDVPPVAIFTQSATIGMMDSCDAHWPEAHHDPRKMATLGSAQARMFGFESVRVPFDITAEATRLGCTIDEGTRDSQPSISGRIGNLDPMSDELPDVGLLMDASEFCSEGRPSIVLDALRICSKEIGDTHPVVGGLLGPVSLLSQLFGAEMVALSTLLSPDWCTEWCSSLAGICKEYAKRQIESGADIVTIVEAVASPDIIDPASFWDLSGGHIRSIRPKGSRVVLHICGSTGPILKDISSCGADSFCPDPMMNPPDVVSEVKGRVSLIGSVDPVGTLLFGTPEMIVDESNRYRDSGFDIIAPGCGLAPRTPDENLHALAGAFRR